ncbi:hypothetical protein R5R35_008811 [Gryllus longicercus]
MWSGKCPYVVPNHFKEQVGIFAPQFSGYQQQDSQELLTFLLDGLHEDLNKIKRKPYIEIKDSDGRPDEVVASEAWEIYRKRNDSIIVDYFHGLLKSTVVCPDCGKVSVTFDPFCNLSLPLPIKRERQIVITFFPSDPTKKPEVLTTMVPKRGHVNDLLCALSHQCGVSPDDLVVTEIMKHHFHKFYSNNDSLENIDSQDSLAVYEVPRIESHVPVPLILWEVNAKQTFSSSQLFGFPMLLMMPRGSCTYQDLYKSVAEKVARYLTLDDPDESSGGASNSNTRNLNPENISQRVPTSIFNLYVVNPSTAAVFKLHSDNKPLQLPFSDTLGRQYLAAQWTTENRKRYLSSQLESDVQGCDTGRQKLSNMLQLKDCLDLFTMCEKLGADDAWYCKDCKRHQRATKKFDLWMLPKILIIHLKRFYYNRFRRDKIDTMVEFPLANLDMSKFINNKKHPPATYNLIGVCNHYGGMGGGHYTAYALNKIDRHWYSFDDHHVSATSPESVITSAAYVLFYMRNE